MRADGSDSAWRGRAKTLATVFYAWYAYQMLGGAEGGPQGLGNELYPEETRPPADDRVVEEYRRYIEHIHAALGRKIPVVFLHIPVSYAIRPSEAARWKHLGHHDPEQRRQQMAALAGRGRRGGGGRGRSGDSGGDGGKWVLTACTCKGR